MNNQGNTPTTMEGEDSSPKSSYQTMEEPDGLVVMAPEIASPSSESHTRSLLKCISWRVVATTTTVIVAWLVLGEPGTALQIGFFEVFAKIAIYYLHERIWAKISV